MEIVSRRRAFFVLSALHSKKSLAENETDLQHLLR